MSRRARLVVAGLVAWVVLSLAGLVVFVVSLNSDGEIERALNERYDAEITFEQYRRDEELTVDGVESPCRTEGKIGSLDDLRIVCPPGTEAPPVRD